METPAGLDQAAAALQRCAHDIRELTEAWRGPLDAGSVQGGVLGADLFALAASSASRCAGAAQEVEGLAGRCRGRADALRALHAAEGSSIETGLPDPQPPG